MASLRVLLLTLVAAALAGCGQQADREKIEREGAGILRPRTDGSLPANMPDYLTVYPGARVTSTVDAGARGGTISFEAAATADQVAAFYRQRATAAGLRQATDVSSNAVRILMFDQGQGGRRNFVLNLTSTSRGVQGALTYGPQG
jgi:hypothetical protein